MYPKLSVVDFFCRVSLEYSPMEWLHSMAGISQALSILSSRCLWPTMAPPQANQMHPTAVVSRGSCSQAWEPVQPVSVAPLPSATIHSSTACKTIRWVLAWKFLVPQFFYFFTTTFANFTTPFKCNLCSEYVSRVTCLLSLFVLHKSHINWTISLFTFSYFYQPNIQNFINFYSFTLWLCLIYLSNDLLCLFKLIVSCWIAFYLNWLPVVESDLYWFRWVTWHHQYLTTWHHQWLPPQWLRHHRRTFHPPLILCQISQWWWWKPTRRTFV